MSKQKFFLSLICLSLGFEAQAQNKNTQYQAGSETVVEKRTEEKDGVKTETTHSGAVRSRQGEPRVGNIEEGETGKFKRRFEALNLSSFGFGPFFGGNDVGANRVLYGFTLGKIYDLTENWEIRADLLGVFNSDGTYMTVGFGPDYIFTDRNLSPFIGFQLGYGGAHSGDLNQAGFTGQFNLGIKMFRLSTAQMEVMGTVSKIFTDNGKAVSGFQFRLLY